MKISIPFFVTLMALTLTTRAFAGSDMGSEGGGNQACYTTNLPANVWSLVSYDNAGQPCLTKPDVDYACDPTATWNWNMHGSLRFTVAPQSRAIQPNSSVIQVQVWVGNGGGSCYGGTSDPIFCDNPATHYKQEDGRFYLQGRGVDTAVPFEFLIYQTQPWFSSYGDANYFGMWVFAKPSTPAICKSTNYGDLVYKDEPQ